MAGATPRHRPPGWFERAVRGGLATQRRPPYIPADPQNNMAALLKTSFATARYFEWPHATLTVE